VSFSFWAIIFWEALASTEMYGKGGNAVGNLLLIWLWTSNLFHRLNTLNLQSHAVPNAC